MAALHVLLVDDHELFRAGLNALLSAVDDFTVVGEAESVDEARAFVASVDSNPELLLNIAVVEIGVSQGRGLELCSDLRDKLPQLRVLVLSNSTQEADLFGALQRGATGFLPKAASVTELFQAIRMVAEGQTVLAPSLTSGMALSDDSSGGDAGGWLDATRQLTARELQVLKLVGLGLHNQDIAQRLSISANTVKNHVHNLSEKMGFRTRMQAVMYAVRTRLVDLDTQV